MKYYTLTALMAVPLFPFVILPLYFRFRTLRYTFDEEGITMRWGLLFRREISLTYARIQDIHLASNLVERWLGLAKVQIQTASGSSGAEMTIEGLPDFEIIRDFLYSRMRGVKEHRAAHAAVATPEGTSADGGLAPIFHQIAGEIRSIREIVERQRSGGSQ